VEEIYCLVENWIGFPKRASHRNLPKASEKNMKGSETAPTAIKVPVTPGRKAGLDKRAKAISLPDKG